MTIEIRRQPVAGSPLAGDYIAGVASATTFYAGSPFDLEGYRLRAERVGRRFGRSGREAAAAALTPTSDAARRRLGRFVEEGGIMVTTGQQAGLLTGPLYTLYKALTAARLAAELESRLGLLVLPVFWTASEDHDWAEVNHAHLSHDRDGVRTVQLADDPHLPLPMSDIFVGSRCRNVLEEVSELIGSEGDSDILIKWIQAAYREESTVSSAFTELLGRLLAPFDFCMTEASQGVVKEVSRGVLQLALAEGAAHEQLLRERTARLEAAGYQGQVSLVPGATNVFRNGERGRERVQLAEGGFRVGSELLSAARVRDELEAEPGRYSPNVLLRPVVESAVFPTVAYVGGPGEIAYFAQASALFPAFGMQPPAVYPRASFLLVDMAMRRLLDKLGMPPEALARPRHELVQELAESSIPAPVREILERLGTGLTAGYRDLIEAAALIDPTLEGALSRLRNEALLRIGESERKITQHVKRREEVRVGQLDRLLAQLRPLGKPQDRVLNPIPFLARHGLSLVARIYDEIDVGLG